jgi:hypothetical protein
MSFRAVQLVHSIVASSAESERRRDASCTDVQIKLSYYSKLNLAHGFAYEIPALFLGAHFKAFFRSDHPNRVAFFTLPPPREAKPFPSQETKVHEMGMTCQT